MALPVPSQQRTLQQRLPRTQRPLRRAERSLVPSPLSLQMQYPSEGCRLHRPQQRLAPPVHQRQQQQQQVLMQTPMQPAHNQR